MTNSHPAPTTVLAHHYLALASGTDQIARAHHWVVDGLVDNNTELTHSLSRLTRRHNELTRELDSLDKTLEDTQDKLDRAIASLNGIAAHLEGNNLELALDLARNPLDPQF